MDINNLMKQAQEMQGKMASIQEDLAKKTITGSAGGGMVEVTVNGQGDILGIKIEDALINIEEKVMLQDLITAASNDAVRRAKDLSKNEMGQLTGGMGLPDLANFLK